MIARLETPLRALLIALVIGPPVGLLLGCGADSTASPSSSGSGVESDERAVGASAERADGPFLRVLGTAQDGGFPHAACHGERCTLAREDPAYRRLVACVAIVLPESGRVFMVDATPDIREQLDRLVDVRDVPSDRVDRSPIDGLFLTHAHMGHYLGLAFFGFEAVHTSDLPVWATPEMAGFLRSQAPWEQLVGLGNIELRELDGRAVSLGDGVTVEALWVPHRDEYTDTVGYRISGPARTVLYIPDTDPWRLWPTPLTEALEGVDVALLDGAFYSADELPGRAVEEIRHPLMGDTMDRLQSLVDAGALSVYFTHMNHSNPVLGAIGDERLEVERRGFAVLDELAEIPL